jgi:hypothetical protein
LLNNNTEFLIKSEESSNGALGFVFASDNSSATIGVVVFVAEGLGFVVQL